jgi:hypothetical protein
VEGNSSHGNFHPRSPRTSLKKPRDEGITLRILGGLAIAIHCQEHKDFARKLGRTGTGID